MNNKNFKRGIGIFLSYFIYSTIILLPLAIFNIDVTKLSQTTKTIYLLSGDFLFISFLIAIYFKDIKKDIIDFKKNYNNYIDDGFKFWIIGLAIMTLTNILISLITPSKMATNEQVVRDLLTKSPVYMFIGACIVAPIIEELIFRKAFRELFKTKWLYIIMSGLVFGGLHVMLLFQNYYELLYIIPYGALGSAFAYLYYKTKNILNPIIMHTIHNTSLVLLFLYTK